MSEYAMLKCGGVEFRPGDVVVVVRDALDNMEDGMGDGMPWQNGWVDEMNAALGDRFIIDFITDEGAHFVNDASEGPEGYAYPLSALENITAKKLQVTYGATQYEHGKAA